MTHHYWTLARAALCDAFVWGRAFPEAPRPIALTPYRDHSAPHTTTCWWSADIPGQGVVTLHEIQMRTRGGTCRTVYSAGECRVLEAHEVTLRPAVEDAAPPFAEWTRPIRLVPYTVGGGSPPGWWSSTVPGVGTVLWREQQRSRRGAPSRGVYVSDNYGVLERHEVVLVPDSDSNASSPPSPSPSVNVAITDPVIRDWHRTHRTDEGLVRTVRAAPPSAFPELPRPIRLERWRDRDTGRVIPVWWTARTPRGVMLLHEVWRGVGTTHQSVEWHAGEHGVLRRDEVLLLPHDETNTPFEPRSLNPSPDVSHTRQRDVSVPTAGELARTLLHSTAAAAASGPPPPPTDLSYSPRPPAAFDHAALRALVLEMEIAWHAHDGQPIDDSLVKALQARLNTWSLRMARR